MSNLFQTISFSMQGKRDYNEDSIFPNAEIPTQLNNLFLVCDGVGGQSKGEIASDLCCTQLNQFFTQQNVEVSNELIINEAIQFVEEKFNSYIEENPEAGDMASTITLLHLHSGGATLAHMGDSRIYLFRNGKIIFQTKDHSVVQDLFDAGVLETEEQMAQHKDRNRINRAMRGSSDKDYKAEIKIISDVQENDLFLLCTDGVLEAFSSVELSELFSQYIDLEEIKNKLTQKCAEKSSDNYSAYVVKITPEYIQQLQS